ncbi:MAG: hypothetical protein V1647_02845 [Pseudomonadota bacterium]
MSTWKDRFFKPEEIAQMEAVFNERFFSFLKNDENIYFEGYFSEQTCYITVTLKNQDETYYYPFETALPMNENPNTSEEEAKITLLDFTGEYFNEFFTNERGTLIPIEWTLYKEDGKNIYARGQVLNKKLEDMAEEVLNGAHDEGDSTKNR